MLAAERVRKENTMRSDVTFDAEGTSLRGWLYLPEQGREPFPLVVMAHGWAGVKEQSLDLFAEAFADAGLAASFAKAIQKQTWPTTSFSSLLRCCARAKVNSSTPGLRKSEPATSANSKALFWY
jgi:dienelactone hydrolase